MKKLVLLIFLFLSAKGFSQNITVNPNIYTPNQLVNNVLVNNSCLAQVSGVSKSTGTDYGYSSGNGIGYFTSTNPTFPFPSGVILSTGNAVGAQGPNSNVQSFSSPAWAGDADLEAALAAQGINILSKNATVLEFNFIAATDNFSFDFIFASEEYGTYQCESNDAFVFLLTNINTGVTTNLAVVPATSMPVTVGNIRNQLFNSACASVNPDFFGNFNGGGNAATSATNFEGRTVLMNASGTLVVNNQYHIKIVVADDGGPSGTDGDFDSAIFLPAGSFNLGQDVFPQDLTLEDGNALCFGETYTLDTGLTDPVYEFAWTQDGGPIAGGSSIIVTEPGDYAVTITNDDTGCTTTQDVVIEYVPQIVPGEPVDLFACENPTGTYTYNLAVNTPLVKQGLDPATIVSYHATENNAENNVLPLPLSYSSAGNQTVWVRIKSHNSSCYAVESFQLLINPAPTANQPANLALCESSQGSGTAIFDLTQQTDDVLGAQNPAEYVVTYFTSQANANTNTSPIETPLGFVGSTQTIYARIHRVSDISCFSVTTFTLTVQPLPVLPEPATVNICLSYTLPALTTGNYFTGIGGTGTMLAAGDEITTSQTVYIYAVSGTVPSCTNQSQIDITILSSVSAPDDVAACQSYILPDLPEGQFYFNGPSGTGGSIPEGSTLLATQDVYFFVPDAADCTGDSNFTVTITQNPEITVPTDTSACSSYTLPALPAGQSYYTGPNATGSELPVGFAITSTQTVFIHAISAENPLCVSDASFQVTINNVSVSDLADVVKCGSHQLAVLPVGNYYTGPGGTGTMINAGTSITISQTLYIYAVSDVDPDCFDEESFTITINPLPVFPAIPAVTVCESYILPELPVGAEYFTGSNGSGMELFAGQEITTTQTIFALSPPNEFNCRRQRQFTVTVVNTSAVELPDVSVCNSYVLPALPVGSYYSGPGGTGTMYTQNQVISTSQTIYIYVVAGTNPVCTAESEFVVTIIPNPNIPPIADVTACDSYTLPALTVGNYYTGPNGTGMMLPFGHVVTSTSTLYAFSQTATTPSCTRQRVFIVTIISGSIAPADVTACGSYTLPAPSINTATYHTAPNGGGELLAVGDEITTTQTIYVYNNVTSGPNCTGNDNFTVTIISAVPADDPADVSACFSYTLPALTNGNYYTGPGGTGTLLPDGTTIATSETLYVYASTNDGQNCATDNSFTVTINTIDVADMPDVLVCDGYVLEPLTTGEYYTAPNAAGALLAAGDLIDTDQTIYIYVESETNPVCFDEESFTVTIKPNPAIDTPGDIGSCGNYILPILTEGAYYTGPGGTGTLLAEGQEIAETTTLYIYAETGGVPNCTSEHMFTIFINPEPPVDVAACGSYTLPVLSVGQYFTGPAGTGDQLDAGTVIDVTQDVYVYIPMATVPNCTDNNNFTITITPNPVLEPVEDVAVCDLYVLPDLAVGAYYTLPGGEGDVLPEGSLVTTTQTIYVYAESGTVPNCTDEASFTVTVNQTPVADARSAVSVCDSYTLDALIAGNYFALPGGPDVPDQVAYAAGDVITDTMIMYIYAESSTTPNCFNENSFEIEVLSITADNPDDVTVCDSYELPALTVGDYYTLPGGPDVTDQVLLEAGDILTATQTLYVYAQLDGRVDCNDENELVITIYETPVVEDTQGDVTVCDQYLLPALAVGDYYTEPGGTGDLLAEGDALTETQTVYIYASADPDGLCFDEHSYVVTVNSIDIEDIEDLFACESYELQPLALGNYFTEPNGAGTQLAAGEVITATQTLYIFGQTNTVPDCTDEESFTITIVPMPVANDADALELCSVDLEGHAVFDLEPALATIIGTQDDVTMTVYESAGEAESLENNIPPAQFAAYENTTAFNQTLYVRLQSDLSAACYTITELELIAHPRPAVPVVTDYVVCDDNNSPDVVEEFDLTSKNTEADGGDATLVVSYYNTEEDALAETSPIDTPDAYTNTTSPETIWVRVENVFGCVSVGSFDLIVNPLPIINTDIDVVVSCEETPGSGGEFNISDLDEEVIGDADGYSVAYYETLNDAQVGGDNELDSTFTSSGTTIYARVTDTDTNCVIIAPIDLEVLPTPMVDEPAPLEECDFDLDHFAIFNLDPVLQDVANQLDNVTVTIHETIDDATFNENVIPNTGSYLSIDPDTQTLYIRMESNEYGCFGIVELQLIANPAPVATEATPYAICDNGADDTDGLAIFDLTTKEAQIMGGLDIAEHTITWHSSMDAAAAGTPVIPTPASYLSGTSPVYARVTIDATGCYDIIDVQLIVNPLPVANDPTPYTLCDEDPDDTAVEIFDLTTKIPEIIDDQEGLIVTFHFEYDEAVANENAIADPYNYPNDPNVETLFVRVTNAETDCYRIVLLDVRVAPLPIILEPTQDELTACDTNGMGIGEFNLQDLVDTMINNGPNLTIAFYETPEDALSGDNPIPNLESYFNQTPFQQDIYVMVSDSGTGCVNSVPYVLTLIVEQAPQAPDLEDITICDDTDNSGQDDSAIFDLTQQDQVIYDALDMTEDELTIHYFTNEDWAYAGAPRITVPENFIGHDQQEIWVRVEDVTSECFSVTSFMLHLDQPLLLTQPTPLTLCNSALPNDNQETFDLTSKDEEILGEFGIGQGMIVEYFESQAAVDANTPIANPEAYTNTVNPKTIFVRVTTEEGCRSYTTLTIRVLPLPVPDTTPDPLVLCDVTNTGDGVEVFNLTDAEDDIRDNDFFAVITYHTNIEDAENDQFPIANPEAYSSGNATIYVRVEANTTNPNDPVCYQIVELELIVTPLPTADDLLYAQCEQGTDGFMEFSLLDFVENLLGPGAGDYDITFYFDQDAYDAGTALPVIYTNEVAFNQPILVHIENLVTDCEALLPMELIVEESAIANPVSAVNNPLVECDYDGTNDGIHLFDLTTVEADVLGTQNPADYTVTYYNTEADALALENAIANPEAYTNTIPLSEIIWVNVQHTNSISKCSDVTSFEIRVELLAEPVISTEGGNNTICVDFNTQEVVRTLLLDSGVAPNGHTFDWYLNGELIASDGAGTYEAMEPGLYTVQVTSANGCVSELSAEFEVIQSGPASPIGTGYYVTDAFSDEQTITVLVEGYGQYEFRLDEDGPWQTSNVFVNVAPGSHTVYVRDVLTEFGCSDLVLAGVSVIDFPKFFTPNGDGYHDTWNIIGLEYQTGAKIYIFDRYGKLMKQISSAGEGWDGTFNGSPVPATDYWFTVTYDEYVGDVLINKEFKAHFSLKR